MSNLTNKRIFLILGLLFISLLVICMIWVLSALRKDQSAIPSFGQVTPFPTTSPRPIGVPTATPKPTSLPGISVPTPSSTTEIITSDPTVKFSSAGRHTIYGFVYVDADADNFYDAHEIAHGGNEIKLTGSVTRTVTTTATGAYSFSDLPTGTYTVTLSTPFGYSVTTHAMTNFYLTTSRLHNVGIKVGPVSYSSDSSPSTPVPTATPLQAHYYVAKTGSDSAAGSESAPYLTIQKAVNTTKTDSYPGAVIHVFPGTYRESVTINTVIGTAEAPVEIKAEGGAETVFVLGSESSQDSRISWAQADGGLSFPTGVSSHIYRANVSVWNATPELAFNDDTTITRLTKAREPDFGVTTEWKYHQNWWKADGVVGVTADSLIDDTNDVSGTYPEADTNIGNLGSINGFTTDFLAGARLFAKDTYDGHDSLTETIATHTASIGTITLDDDLEYYDGNPAMGEYTKYYIEGKPQLLDQEGEWYYDDSTDYLYIWPEDDVNPNTLNLEFAIRNTAFSFRNSKYVTLKDLNLQFTNYAYSGVTGPDGAVRFFGFTDDITDHITLDGLHIQHNGVGVRMYQSNALTTSPGTLNNVTIRDSVVNYSDAYGLMAWHFPLNGPNPFINNIRLEGNEFGHMGFRGSGVGLFMQHPEKILATNNYFHHSAHNNFDIQQGKATGDSYIYIANNLFDASCYNGTDCGAMKILNSDGGTGSNTILVTHNIIRGTKGWTYASEAQNENNSPLGYGYSGFGYYSDVVEHTGNDACAVLVYRNLIYNNSMGGIHLTRSRDQCAFNNVLAQNGVGIQMNNYGATVDGSFNNILRQNIFQHTESGNSTNANIYGIIARINKADEDELEVDQNRYQMSGVHAFDMFKQDISFTNVGTFTTVSEIQSNTPWEDNGLDVTGGTVGVTTETHYDISAIESLFGISSVSFPSEANTIIEALESHYGISITNSSTVGRSE